MVVRNVLLILFMMVAGVAHGAQEEGRAALLERLGRALFFDASLSEPAGQACASCHAPGAGFADPDAELPLSRGADPRLFGNRNTPAIAYVAHTPEFHYDEEEGLYIGGFFLDGRAHTLEAQAKGPLLNPVEMANPDLDTLIAKVRRAPYAPLLERLHGEAVWSDPARAFDAVAEAIAAFERSAYFAPFSSKYDAYLRGEAQLSPQELRGLKLFEDEKKGNCAACHPSRPAADGTPPLFTDFSYDNLGLPRLKESPFYTIDRRYNPAGAAVVDLGLGGVLRKREEEGKFKVPSLRNVAITAPYMHNGLFGTLEEVVAFYNRRDVEPRRWGPPEVARNVNRDELGDLGLSRQEEADLVAFLKTLTDGWRGEGARP